MQMGESELEFFHTPGHTSGSLCVSVGREAVFVATGVSWLPAAFSPFATSPNLSLQLAEHRGTSARMLFLGTSPGYAEKFVADYGRFNQPDW
jgi:hypothetical protein